MTETTTTPKMASGSLFISALEFVKQQKPEAASALDQGGAPLLFDAHRMYPLEQLQNLHTKILEAVFGVVDDAGYRALARHTFLAFANSMIGATLTTGVTTPTIFLNKVQEVWGAYVNFGTRELTTIDESEGKATLHLVDDPRNPAYLQALVETGFSEMLQLQDVSTSIVRTSPEEYSLEISWEPKI